MKFCIILAVFKVPRKIAVLFSWHGFPRVKHPVNQTAYRKAKFLVSCKQSCTLLEYSSSRFYLAEGTEICLFDENLNRKDVS